MLNALRLAKFVAACPQQLHPRPSLRTNLTRLCALALLGSLSSHVWSGMELEYQAKDGNHPSTLIMLQKDSLRINLDGNQTSPEKSNFLLFKRSANELILVDHKKRSFTVMSQAALAQMSQQMNQRYKELEKKFAGLSPEERKQAEAMLASVLPSFAEKQAKTATTINDTGKTKTVNGLSCQLMETKRGSEKTAEFCLVSFKQIKMSTPEQQTLLAFQAHMTNFLNSLPTYGDLVGAGFLKQIDQDQLPIQFTEYQTGQAISYELKQVKSQTFPDQLFLAPRDYKKQSFSTLF